MHNPLVSIIIPTFNRAHLISETLDSLLAQTYQQWECIVIDDGSTDNTADIVSSFTEKDARFQYHPRPNSYPKGAHACRNYGFELSKGAYINWLDSDDLISPNKLEYQVSALLANDFDVLICEWLFFTDTNTLNYSKARGFKDFNTGIELLNYLGATSTYIPIHAYLTRSEMIKASGRWNESLKINQDGEFMVRVLLQANTIKFVANAYALYRKSTNDSVSSYKNGNLDDLIKSWKLIAAHCSAFIAPKQNIYVSSAKKRIFKNLRDKHFYFIIKNFFFFREAIGDALGKKLKKYI